MAVDKLVDSTQLDADLTSVANAIRIKGGTSAQLAFPAGFVSAVQAIPTGTTPTGTKSISITANGTTTEDVAAYASAEITVDVQGGGGGGISLDDFMNRTAPTGAVSLPTVTQLPGYSFYDHNLITSISAPNLTRLGAYDFAYCDELVNVNMPELLYACSIDKSAATIANTDNCYAFAWCDNLGTVRLPNLIKSGKGLFWQCGYGKSTAECLVVLPSITMLGHSACRQGKFIAVDLGPNLTALNTDAFYNATVGALILRSPTLVTAGSRDAVRKITTLFVPSALVSDYATATNWVTDASSRTVLPIEGSQYENYYADGTPIT